MEDLKFTGRCAITLQDKTVTPMVTVAKTLKDDSQDGNSINIQYVVLLGFMECLGCDKLRQCDIAKQVAPTIENINGRGDSFSPIY